MNDAAVGRALRAIRLAQKRSQGQVAVKAQVSRQLVGRVESGMIAKVDVGTVRAIAAALDALFDPVVRWHGGDMGRLVNSRHSAMHEGFARLLGALPGWTFDPEVSFSYFGERGVIDVLGWHPEAATILVIELKTEIVDVQELMGTMDRRVRLAPRIASDRGYSARHVGAWVILANDRSNHRRLHDHGAVLRSKFPSDGRSISSWLTRPSQPIWALSFMPNDALDGLKDAGKSVPRVRRPALAVPLHRGEHGSGRTDGPPPTRPRGQCT